MSNAFPEKVLSRAQDVRVLTQPGKLLVVQTVVFFDQFTDQLRLGQKQLKQVHISLNGFTSIAGQKDQKASAIGRFRS